MGTAVRTPIGKTIEVVAKTGNWEPIVVGDHNYNLVNALAWMPGWGNSLKPGKYSLRISWINTDIGQVGSQTVTISNAVILNQYHNAGRSFVDFQVTAPDAVVSVYVKGYNRKFGITGIITRGILEDGAF